MHFDPLDGENGAVVRFEHDAEIVRAFGNGELGMQGLRRSENQDRKSVV